MSEQNRVPGDLRVAMRHWVAAECAALACQGELCQRSAEAGLVDAQAALDASLAATEARIGRLVRFVRADDALDGAIVDWADAAEYHAAVEEKRAARAALTAEDLAP